MINRSLLRRGIEPVVATRTISYRTRASIQVSNAAKAVMCLAPHVPDKHGMVGHFPVVIRHVANACRRVLLPQTRREVILLSLFTIVSLFLGMYTFHRGLRRTIQFWKAVAPLAAEYKWIQFWGKHTSVPGPVLEERISQFHKKSAPVVVQTMLRLGGISVKFGQVLSTVGTGLLDDAYVQALRPLQDGVPPRDYAEISRIIEASTGQRMQDMFELFEEIPIGAASIAQAHRAVLKDGNQQVVVKVQYPDVAELFDIDFNNMELATRWLNPDMLDLVKALRKRHENELDFTLEADNLRRASENMQAHGVEPALVRVPRVMNETGVCSPNVLVMEYLEGTSLASAIEIEQNRVAKALGQPNAQELRKALTKRMREHFERGGGGVAGDGTMSMMASSKLLRPAGTATVARLLRFYARARERIENAAVQVQVASSKFARALRPGGAGARLSDEMKLHHQSSRSKALHQNINLNRALKILIHVHGLQMLKDGFYNADPHPGNVLVLRDGRLGLLDYGMVVKLTNDERRNIAKTVVALSKHDKQEAARIYTDAGYRVTWKESPVTDANLLHRFATFHLDRIDLSPVKIEKKSVEIMDIFRATRERSIPLWIEQARRLGGLLIGVAAQAARPVSLSQEWKRIASQVVQEEKEKEEKDS